jgi:undecaprenyl diphosphate synthase
MLSENELFNKIDKNKLPRHVAIIMDGNGRWAKKQGLSRIYGHKKGTEAVRQATEACAELNIPYLTLYAFSTENWNRPKEEVNALMELLVDTMEKELPTLQKNNIKLNTIGNIKQLPEHIYKKLIKTIQLTSTNTHLTLTIALSYSSQWEIMEMVKKIAYKIKEGTLQPEEINNTTIEQNLDTYPLPFPDLLIRTSNEYRISNFLLYQLAYTELHFTPVLWPDFSKNDFYNAIIDYQSRERRFGKISDQLK